MERILQFMDRNRNNQLDPEELQRMPPPLRDAFSRFGLNGSRPVSLQELERVLPRVWEEMRREREERERRYRDDDRDRGFDRGERGFDRDGRSYGDRGFGDRRYGDRGDPRTARQSQRPRFQPRKREPVTAVLPENWQPLDANGDNQIALYEMPRERWSEFRRLDLNGDGFATPAEILYLQAREASEKATGASRPSPGSSAATTSASGGGSPRPGSVSVTAVARPVAGPGAPGSGSPRPGSGPRPFGGPVGRSGRFGGPFGRRDRGGSPQNGSGPSEQYARYVFQVLDRNRDGTIDADEWQRSQRTRQSFERAGVNVSFPMSFDAFWQHYQKVGSGR